MSVEISSVSALSTWLSIFLSIGFIGVCKTLVAPAVVQVKASFSRGDAVSMIYSASVGSMSVAAVSTYFKVVLNLIDRGSIGKKMEVDGFPPKLLRMCSFFHDIFPTQYCDVY